MNQIKTDDTKINSSDHLKQIKFENYITANSELKQLFGDFDGFSWFNYPSYVAPFFGFKLQKDFIIDCHTGSCNFYAWSESKRLWSIESHDRFIHLIATQMCHWFEHSLQSNQLKVIKLDTFKQHDYVNDLCKLMFDYLHQHEWSKDLDVLSPNMFIVGEMEVFDSLKNERRTRTRNDKYTITTLYNDKCNFNYRHFNDKVLKRMNTFTKFRNSSKSIN